MTEPTIYVAGPMTGHPNMNAEAFDRAQVQLEAAGWHVLSPADGDRQHGIDHSSGSMTAEEYMDAALRDLNMLDVCDAIYFLDGYEQSPGAKWEWAYAKKRRLTMFYQTPTPNRLEGN